MRFQCEIEKDKERKKKVKKNMQKVEQTYEEIKKVGRINVQWREIE